MIDNEAGSSFLAFLCCQLRMEALHCLNFQLDEELCQDEKEVWASYQIWVNLEKKSRVETWVPFHTVLGAHERFIVKTIYDADVDHWTEKRRLIVHFIFRAHCCMEMFANVQLPLLTDPDFWDTEADLGFGPEGVMQQRMLAYKKSGKCLQTCAFRMIPKKHCEDKAKNHVLSICSRSMDLKNLAALIFPHIQESKDAISDVLPAAAQHISTNLYTRLSEFIRDIPGLGCTWAKMLMVSIDIRYPELKLCKTGCEVGSGATTPLLRLMPTGSGTLKEKLEKLVRDLNGDAISALPIAHVFKRLLKKLEHEALARVNSPMLTGQFVENQGLTAATVQVQLCEWRQFLKHRGPSPVRMNAVPEASAEVKTTEANNVASAKAETDHAVSDDFYLDNISAGSDSSRRKLSSELRQHKLDAEEISITNNIMIITITITNYYYHYYYYYYYYDYYYYYYYHHYYYCYYYYNNNNYYHHHQQYNHHLGFSGFEFI